MDQESSNLFDSTGRHYTKKIKYNVRRVKLRTDMHAVSKTQVIVIKSAKDPIFMEFKLVGPVGVVGKCRSDVQRRVSYEHDF